MTATEIMVVEDERIVARNLQNELEGLGYKVPAIASSGKEALEKIEDTLPDLVLMDIVLKGDMDGVEVSDQIRDRFDIPVVYLTAYADDATLRRAKITEPYGYLVKPYEEKELRTTIELALFRHRLQGISSLQQPASSFPIFKNRTSDGLMPALDPSILLPAASLIS